MGTVESPIYIYIYINLLLFQKYVRIYHFWVLKLKKLVFSIVFEFHEIEFFEKIAFKFAKNVLMELEYHKKF